MKYLFHYKFINVTTFNFVGDSIIEALNSGLKRSDVTISTNTNIDTSALTQIQIGRTQAGKSTGTYYVIDFEIMV